MIGNVGRLGTQVRERGLLAGAVGAGVVLLGTLSIRLREQRSGQRARPLGDRPFLPAAALVARSAPALLIAAEVAECVCPDLCPRDHDN